MNASKARARQRRGGRSQGLPLFPIAIGAIVLLGIVAIVLTVSGSDGGTGKSTETRPVTVSGELLPAVPQQQGTPDPAIGKTAPTLAGENFAGEAVTIKNDGRPKVIAFVAHWCPHCQKEVPRLSDYFKKTGMPAGVDFYFVSTSVDPGKNNYPPSSWLKREKVDNVPTIVDDAKSKALIAFGGGGFPFLNFIDKNGKVVLRTEGELPDGAYDQYFNALAKGQPLTAAGG